MPGPAETDATLSIGELAARTGVGEATLRMWERRHGFPAPERLASGHRRYRAGDVELVAEVVRERSAGVSLAAAIARVSDSAAEHEPSIFAGLRRRSRELQPVVMRKPTLLALSRAIEDESCALAERALLFGSFQRERFYRQSQRRWRDFARTAELAVVFADFERMRAPAGRRSNCRSTARARSRASGRWSARRRGHAVCLAGVELLAAQRRHDAARRFDVIWSVEPAVVRTAAQVCLSLLRRAQPELAERVADSSVVALTGPPVRSAAPPRRGDREQDARAHRLKRRPPAGRRASHDGTVGSGEGRRRRPRIRRPRQRAFLLGSSAS